MTDTPPVRLPESVDLTALCRDLLQYPGQGDTTDALVALLGIPIGDEPGADATARLQAEAVARKIAEQCRPVRAYLLPF